MLSYFSYQRQAEAKIYNAFVANVIWPGLPSSVETWRQRKGVEQESSLHKGHLFKNCDSFSNRRKRNEVDQQE